MYDTIWPIMYGRCGTTIEQIEVRHNRACHRHPDWGWHNRIGEDCFSWHNRDRLCQSAMTQYENVLCPYKRWTQYGRLVSNRIPRYHNMYRLCHWHNRYVTVYHHLMTFLLCPGHNRICFRHNRFWGDTIGHLLCIFPFPVYSSSLVGACQSSRVLFLHLWSRV